jgi:Mor family transcriptional regulator
VPKSHFKEASSRAALEEAILQGTTSAQFKQILMSCPTQYQGDTQYTSVTEAWRDCLWSVVVGTFWNYGTSVEDIKSAYRTSTEAIRRVKELTPESGAYASEADMHEEDYGQTFWGSNYPRLLDIKHK